MSSPTVVLSVGRVDMMYGYINRFISLCSSYMYSSNNNTNTNNDIKDCLLKTSYGGITMEYVVSYSCTISIDVTYVYIHRFVCLCCSV